MSTELAGLDLLATAVVALDEGYVVRYANPAAENLLDAGARSMIGQAFAGLFDEKVAVERSLAETLKTHWEYTAQAVTYGRPGHEPLPLSCVVTRIDACGLRLLVELRPIEQQLRLAREERMVSEQQANRELIRNLAHEIKNPLGGLRGSAQLLERELEKPDLKEYTQVIIKEADRLQALMDRLLTPHRAPRIAPVNIHEVLERVRSLTLAEFSSGVAIARDSDPSVPDVLGDNEQLIQAVLNIARNAAQALTSGEANAGKGGAITFRTRAIRQVTLVRNRYRLALELRIMDDGPGVAENLRDRIFNPLVSGREGGSGLGLSLAQTYVQYHRGVIECDSRPGRTVFTILLPLA
ncbi:MAG: nitrogen regulation protein NR(II) [Burkholderiales bacterium]